MRIGVFPVSDPSAGGVYQYSLMVLRALESLRDRVDSVIVHDRAPGSVMRDWQAAGWRPLSCRPRSVRTIGRSIIAASLGDRRARRMGAAVRGLAARRQHLAVSMPAVMPSLEDDQIAQERRRIGSWLRGHGIELMLFTAPSQYGYRCGIPYVMAVHDLQHRLQPEFPEVSANGEWEAREALFSRAIASASAIVVDSNTGREDVLAFYGQLISADRIKVLPYALPPYLKLPAQPEIDGALATVQISGQYFLFPAQFWPHKNHRRVVEALDLLRQQGLTVQVVMTGSADDQLRAQTLAEVRQILERSGLDGQVRFVGYVDDDTMAALYAGAAGVLLPTFFGPTNIPVIEAWAMGVPVLTSDIRGIREQCGDAALLVDPRSTKSIADGIRRLLNDEPLRLRLAAAGKSMLARNSAEDFRDTLGQILINAAANPRTATARQFGRGAPA